MQKIIILIVLALFSIGLIAAENPIALLFQAKGDIELDRAAAKSSITAGEMLENDDKLTTGDKSYAAVKFTDNGSLLKMFPWSVVTINGTKDGDHLAKKAKLEAGQMFSKINNNLTGQYRLETSNTVASVKGTSFLSIVDPEGNTWIHMFQGLLEVENTINGKRFNLEPGQTAESRSDGEVNIGPTPKLNDEIMEFIKDDLAGTQKIKVQVKDADGNIKYIEIESAE
ncbi:MAG: FecR domain-containing protein [Candidatus Cloacimonetes bacterium]|nr:FecR domain-containing protein [Candidatus Cloacimonadota bacterium]